MVTGLGNQFNCNVISFEELNSGCKQYTAQQLSNEWSHFMVLSIESKVRKLCITNDLTLAVKGLSINKSLIFVTNFI